MNRGVTAVGFFGLAVVCFAVDEAVLVTDCQSSLQARECVVGRTRGGILDDPDDCYLTCDFVVRNLETFKGLEVAMKAGMLIAGLGCVFALIGRTRSQKE